MAKLLEFAADGGTVLVEVRSPGEDVVAVGVLDTAVEKVEATLDDALCTIARMANSFRDAIAVAPVETAELEFSLQFTGKGTVYVVEAQGQAAMRVKLTLRPQQGEQSDR